MGSGLILGTTFLVDLEREIVRRTPGPAQAFLGVRDQPLYLTFTVVGEVAAGTQPGARHRWEQLIAPFEVLPCTQDVCWEYGQAFQFLKRNGLLIGANDLWIAATALAFGKPVVTRNLREFQRIPGLTVLDYTTA